MNFSFRFNRSERYDYDCRQEELAKSRDSHLSRSLNCAIRSPLPEYKPNTLLLPNVLGFLPVSEAPWHQLRTVPVLQEGIQ